MVKSLKITGNFYLFLLAAGIFVAGFFWVQPVQAFKLGEHQDFFVDAIYDAAGRAQVGATLRQVGDHALFYTADDWWTSLNATDAEIANAAILNLAGEFDKTIYPRLTQVLGSEWSPGIDDDLRITIFITKIKNGTGGYFNSVDEYPRAQLASSNEREMLYLNSLYLTSPSAKVFLAHEFQHMINFYQKEKLRNSVEDVWLNEARSEYAATLCGYDNIYQGSNLERRVRDFLRAPTDSLTEWQNEPSDYGVANLFMQYLVARYGEPLLTRMMKAEMVGIASVNQALAEGGFRERFGEIFSNWLIANFVNDCRLGEGQKYCYLNPNLSYGSFHARPQTSNILMVRDGAGFSFSDATKPWSGRGYEILPLGGGLNLALNFQGEQSGNFQAALVIFNVDGTKSLRSLKLNSAQAAGELVAGFGNQVADVILILSEQSKQANFTASETARQFSYNAKITSADRIITPSTAPTATPVATPSTTPAVSPGFPDGSLVRAKGDTKVYIIKGQYRRWLQTPQILAAYPHLGWQSVIEIEPEQLSWYREAWLVRADGDSRVYEINGDLTKHWLNMTASAFASSGRAWEMVYIINAQERDIYRTGAEVLK